MSTDKRFGMLRGVLRALGLSQEAADDIVNWIVDLLAGQGKSDMSAANAEIFPYQLRDNFLTPAELNFYEVLREVVASKATLCAKVGLGDIFWVKKDDPSRYRIYTNKIDRKHVDFLLCDKLTMRPLVGIELDDKSHQRADRQERDAFVDQVFAAALLPLVHIPTKRTYVAAELANQLSSFIGDLHRIPTAVRNVEPSKTRETDILAPKLNVKSSQAENTRRCPKCGSEMILRTAKSGTNAGNQFWGCSTYPTCRAMMPYQG